MVVCSRFKNLNGNIVLLFPYFSSTPSIARTRFQFTLSESSLFPAIKAVQGDFPGSPVVKNSPSNAGYVGLIWLDPLLEN